MRFFMLSVLTIATIPVVFTVLVVSLELLAYHDIYKHYRVSLGNIGLTVSSFGAVSALVAILISCITKQIRMVLASASLFFLNLLCFYGHVCSFL